MRNSSRATHGSWGRKARARTFHVGTRGGGRRSAQLAPNLEAGRDPAEERLAGGWGALAGWEKV